MASILDSMSSMLTPDVVGKLGKGLDIDPSLINKGMAVTGPLTMSTLAQKTSTADGARGFADLLANVEAASGQSSGGGAGDPLAGLLGGGSGGDLGGMLSGVMGLMGTSGGAGGGMMEGILGQGINAISGSLSQKLGFDCKPMLTMAVPLVMGLINKAKRSGGLDAKGMAEMLQAETQTYAANPANQSTLELINEATAAGEKAAALRGKFSDADWRKVRMAPTAATYLVAKASPSWGSGATKELAAAADAVSNAVKAASPTSLLNTAFGGGQPGDELDILQRDAPSDDSILKSLGAAKAAVAAQSPAEAAAFSSMVIRVAEDVANAAKEGGFLGFGGKQVSDAEAAALNAIKAALK